MEENRPVIAEPAPRPEKFENTVQGCIKFHYIHPESNICEVVFSEAGYPLTDRNKRLNSERFDRRIFLIVKNNILNISDINSVLNYALAVIAIDNYCSNTIENVRNLLIQSFFTCHLL